MIRALRTAGHHEDGAAPRRPGLTSARVGRRAGPGRCRPRSARTPGTPLGKACPWGAHEAANAADCSRAGDGVDVRGRAGMRPIAGVALASGQWAMGASKIPPMPGAAPVTWCSSTGSAGAILISRCSRRVALQACRDRHGASVARDGRTRRAVPVRISAVRRVRCRRSSTCWPSRWPCVRCPPATAGTTRASHAPGRRRATEAVMF